MVPRTKDDREAFAEREGEIEKALAVAQDLAASVGARGRYLWRQLTDGWAGEVIKEGEDFFGRNVIMAARPRRLGEGRYWPPAC
jgi:hypothetical protein